MTAGGSGNVSAEVAFVEKIAVVVFVVLGLGAEMDLRAEYMKPRKFVSSGILALWGYSCFGVVVVVVVVVFVVVVVQRDSLT